MRGVMGRELLEEGDVGREPAVAGREPAAVPGLEPCCGEVGLELELRGSPCSSVVSSRPLRLSLSQSKVIVTLGRGRGRVRVRVSVG